MPIKNSHQTALQRANDLLDNVPLVDGHNDLPWVIRHDKQARGDVAAYGLERVHQETDTDIPRLREGKVAAQWWAAFVSGHERHPGRAVLEQIDLVHRMNALHADVFMAATRASDIAKAKQAGKIASFLAIEGGVGLENSLEPLRIWQRAGARLMTLCHNETLDWVDSATDAPRSGGLSTFGRAVVLELNRLGMIIDCAHVAPSVMRQVLEISRAPIVFSHSNALTLCDHPRNVPDDVLAQLKVNGGMVMATFIPKFLIQHRREWERRLENPHGGSATSSPEVAASWDKIGSAPKASLTSVADHMEYIAGKIGTGHLGIGSDFFGGPTPDGLESVARFPHLIAELISRGWSDTNLAKVMSGNFLRVFRAVERTGKQLSASEAPRLGRVEDLDGAAAGSIGNSSKPK